MDLNAFALVDLEDNSAKRKTQITMIQMSAKLVIMIVTNTHIVSILPMASHVNVMLDSMAMEKLTAWKLTNVK